MNAGTGVSYVGALAILYASYSLYDLSNQRCWHQHNGESLPCRNCHRRYDDDECIQEGPQQYANRDDLMDTGFWPADWLGPLNVTIYNISGVDFTAGICPPANWSEVSSDSMAPIASSLYLTLTEVAELGDELEKDSNVGLIVVGAFLGVCCCACVGSCFGIWFKGFLEKKQQSARHSEKGVHTYGPLSESAQ